MNFQFVTHSKRECGTAGTEQPREESILQMEKLAFGLRTSNKWNCVWSRTNVIEKAITCKNVKIPLAGQIDSEIRSAGRFAMRILMIEMNREKKQCSCEM